MSWLSTAWGRTGGAASDAVGSALYTLFTDPAKALEATKSGLSAAGSAVATGAGKAWDGTVSGVSWVGNKTAAGFNATTDALASAMYTLYTDPAKAWEATKSGLSTAGSAIATGAAATGNFVAFAVTNPQRSIPLLIQGTQNAVVSISGQIVDLGEAVVWNNTIRHVVNLGLEKPKPKHDHQYSSTWVKNTTWIKVDPNDPNAKYERVIVNGAQAVGEVAAFVAITAVTAGAAGAVLASARGGTLAARGATYIQKAGRLAGLTESTASGAAASTTAVATTTTGAATTTTVAATTTVGATTTAGATTATITTGAATTATATTGATAATSVTVAASTATATAAATTTTATLGTVQAAAATASVTTGAVEATVMTVNASKAAWWSGHQIFNPLARGIASKQGIWSDRVVGSLGTGHDWAQKTWTFAVPGLTHSKTLGYHFSASAVSLEAGGGGMSYVGAFSKSAGEAKQYFAEQDKEAERNIESFYTGTLTGEKLEDPDFRDYLPEANAFAALRETGLPAEGLSVKFTVQAGTGEPSVPLIVPRLSYAGWGDESKLSETFAQGVTAAKDQEITAIALPEKHADMGMNTTLALGPGKN